MYMYIYICIYIYIHVCVCICIYIYIYSKSATNSPRIARITINRSTQTNFLVTNPHLLGNDYLDNRSIASNSSSTNTLNAIGLQGFMGMGNICDSTTSSDSHGDTMSLEQLLLAVQEETDIHIYNIYI